MVPYLRHCVWAWALRRDCVRKTCTSTPLGSPTSATDSESKDRSNIVLCVFLCVLCQRVLWDLHIIRKPTEKPLKLSTYFITTFCRGITERIPNVVLNGHPEKRYIGNLNFSFAFVEGESLLMVSYLVLLFFFKISDIIFCSSVFCGTPTSLSN